MRNSHWRVLIGRLYLMLFCFVFCQVQDCCASPQQAKGLRGRLIVGYQGWFGCPGDLDDNKQWQYWFHQEKPTPANLKTDMLPCLTEFNTQDLCETDLRRIDGTPVRLYSAQSERIVATHFKWMEGNGIDGAAIQRFVRPLSDQNKRKRNDQVAMNARAGAEAAGRVFFITYDVSGANPETVTDDIRKDWAHLVNDLKLTTSTAYLHENGQPVLQLWGFGFASRPGSPKEVGKLIQDLKEGGNGLTSVTLIGGVPSNWLSLTGDSKTDPEWANVYRAYHVISPWSVGRFADYEGVNKFVRNRILPDLHETRRLGIGYMPVIFPGFSWFNLQTGLGSRDKAILNQIPRRCGQFLWYQVYCLLNAGVDMFYGAMFDEVNEGTALFPVEPRQERLVSGARMVSLADDGCALPEDWYLRIAGKAAEYLREGKVPPKRLENVIRP